MMAKNKIIPDELLVTWEALGLDDDVKQSLRWLGQLLRVCPFVDTSFIGDMKLEENVVRTWLAGVAQRIQEKRGTKMSNTHQCSTCANDVNDECVFLKDKIAERRFSSKRDSDWAYAKLHIAQRRLASKQFCEWHSYKGY